MSTSFTNFHISLYPIIQPRNIKWSKCPGELSLWISYPPALFASLFLSVSLYYFPSPLLSDVFIFRVVQNKTSSATKKSDCVICAVSGSSSFESQKMDRPSISVTSPMSPSMLRDAPQYLSGQLSVSNRSLTWGQHVKSSGGLLTTVKVTWMREVRECNNHSVQCLKMWLET